MFMETIRGIIAEAGSLGYDAQICSGEDEREELEAVSGSGYPYVRAGHCGGDEGLLSVAAKLDMAAYETAQQLVRAGYELGTSAARGVIEQIRYNNWECKNGPWRLPPDRI
jgi:DNA-binding LacI/PurR family transcriptional regulator